MSFEASRGWCFGSRSVGSDYVVVRQNELFGDKSYSVLCTLACGCNDCDGEMFSLKKKRGGGLD